MPATTLVRALRSGLEESVHEGDVAVVDRSGRLVAFAGEPDRSMFARSCMKPLQAAVSLSFAPPGFPDDEVAVMCASHNAEAVHVATVRSLLARAGVAESALQCPSMRPWDEETATVSPEHRPINSDCSGKHAGMLAACRAQGWPLESYRERDHPIQRSVHEAVLRMTGLEQVRRGVDGCGVPVHGMPLRAMATIYARLSDPTSWGPLGPQAGRAVEAMLAAPYLVAGRHRADTAVMRETGRVVVKGGAEGLICASVLDLGLGVALKVRDGSPRAPGPALIHALSQLGVLDAGQVERLAPFGRPAVLGGGADVGELVAEFALRRP